MAAQRGHTKSGGRRKGTPNRATAEIKAAFQKHGDDLVDALLKLTKSDDERVRLGAIQAALDRGWGKAAQTVDLGVEVAITRIERSIVDPQALGAPLVSIAPTNGTGGHPAEDGAERTPDGGAPRASTLPTSAVRHRAGLN